MATSAGDFGINVDLLDRRLRTRFIEPGRMAGCVLLVSRDGDVVHHSALGMADVERGRPMQPDAIFRIYSMSKPIVSAALLQLVERGLLKLSDPVHRFIPEWRGLRVLDGGEYPHYRTRPAAREMTVHDLLSHQSGLTYGFQGGPLEAGYFASEVYRAGAMRGRTLQSMIDRLAELPLKFSPGEHWNYGVSTDVCGHLIEQLSGQRLDEFLRAQIFEPLGMADTDFDVPPDKHDRLAENYEVREEGLVPSTLFGADEFLEPPAFLSGGGGLVSTAQDYWRFCQMLLNGGQLDDARVLQHETVQLMTTNQIAGGRDIASAALGDWADASNRGVGFGLGLAVLIDSGSGGQAGSVGEYYWEGSASTTFWVDPTSRTVVIFLTQLMPPGTIDVRVELKRILSESDTS